MITIRRANDRGKGDYGWLKTAYTFSFANYYDPDFMGFHDLRAINEDVIAPSRGFDTHDHADMEIVTWVISGELTHRDSMGNVGILRANEAQAMSAGTGVSHSEHNESAIQPVHLLQIWIEPDAWGKTPVYDQKTFPLEQRRGTQQIIASPDGRDGSLRIGQDMIVSILHLEKETSFVLADLAQKSLWIQNIAATFRIQDAHIRPSDGVAIENEERVELFCDESGDILLFTAPLK